MSTESLTADQQIRIAALNAAVQQYNGVEFDGIEVTLEAAVDFEKYIRGEAEGVIQIHATVGEISYTNDEPPDLTGCEISVNGNLEKHTHLPQNNRDRKEPWCRACGLNKHGQKPAVIVGEPED